MQYGKWKKSQQNRDCLPEIATSACGLLAMTIRGAVSFFSPSIRQNRLRV
jgi:hypothetical protein